MQKLTGPVEMEFWRGTFGRQICLVRGMSKSYPPPFSEVKSCLQNTHFYKQKGPCFKRPLNWTGSIFPPMTSLNVDLLWDSGSTTACSYSWRLAHALTIARLRLQHSGHAQNPGVSQPKQLWPPILRRAFAPASMRNRRSQVSAISMVFPQILRTEGGVKTMKCTTKTLQMVTLRVAILSDSSARRLSQNFGAKLKQKSAQARALFPWKFAGTE